MKGENLCWKWIERCEVNLDDYTDCLDNPTEKDLVYYTSTEKDKDCQEIYGMLLQIVSYTAMQAITEKGLSLPQYLDDIDDEYLYSIINLAIKRYRNIEEKIKIVIKYCNDKIINELNTVIKMNEVISI
ncbi:MAG: Imm6 family immunity protein [Bacillota bacterium]|nr:Imm6 family immunity protein [Bacillota bacterium]